MDNLSQASFKTAVTNNSFQVPKKVYMDGESFDGEYLTKAIVTDSKITIQTPDNIKPKVSGDKVAVVRYLQIHDATITTPADQEKTIFVAKAVRQRNNFDSTGHQTDIIGYGIFNAQIQRWQLDSQFFEVDSLYPIIIQLYIMDRTNPTNLTIYQVPQDQKSFIYYDIQTTYNFL